MKLRLKVSAGKEEEKRVASCLCRNDMADGELVEACALPVSNDGAPITILTFDPSEELIFSASGSGMVYAHLIPSMELYSAFQADVNNAGTPAVGMFPNPFGLAALTHDAVRFFSKGGLPLGEIVLDELAGAACGCMIASSSAAQLAVSVYGSEGPALSILDLNIACVTTSISLDAPATLARLEHQTNLLCLAGADGTVATYDVRAGGGVTASNIEN